MRVPARRLRRLLVGLTVLLVVVAIASWSSTRVLARLSGTRAAGAVGRMQETVSEAGLTAKIRAKMSLDDSVRARSIDISTRGSVVTLRGAVASSAAKARAIELARETAGVTSVLDDLVIDEPAGSLTAQNASLRAQVGELQTNLAGAGATAADLRAQNDKLQAQLTAAEATGSAQGATIQSLVEELFNTKDGTGAGTAARDVTRTVLKRATAAAGANDRQVRLAQTVFDRGEAALQAGRPAEARAEFRTALDLAELALTRP